MSIIPLIQNCKDDIKNFLLKKMRVKRVYIVGCSRSGTTMLHYAMIAFKDTVLFDKETNIWSHPNMRDIFLLYKENYHNNNNIFYISKRHAKWWYYEDLYKSLYHIMKYDVYLINIVRDPRDVLTSKHPFEKRKYYVEPWYWEKSIESADILIKNLGIYRNKLTIKYEELVFNSNYIENKLKNNLGLNLRDNINSWSSLKDNVEKSFDNNKMIPYMHKLRNFDRDSIGKWKNSEENKKYVEYLLKKSEYRKKIMLFMEKYEYV